MMMIRSLVSFCVLLAVSSCVGTLEHTDFCDVHRCNAIMNYVKYSSQVVRNGDAVHVTVEIDHVTPMDEFTRWNLTLYRHGEWVGGASTSVGKAVGVEYGKSTIKYAGHSVPIAPGKTHFEFELLVGAEPLDYFMLRAILRTSLTHADISFRLMAGDMASPWIKAENLCNPSLCKGVVHNIRVEPQRVCNDTFTRADVHLSYTQELNEKSLWGIVVHRDGEVYKKWNWRLNESREVVMDDVIFIYKGHRCPVPAGESNFTFYVEYGYLRERQHHYELSAYLYDGGGIGVVFVVFMLDY